MITLLLKWSMVALGAILLTLVYTFGAHSSGPAPSPPTPPVVAVTGASGFLAGNVVRALLKENYAVRGSVRSLKDKAKVEHLRRMFPQVELYEADLLQNGSFARMFQGCTYVLHTASPFRPKVPDPQRDLVDPALLGTLNVLTEALRTPSVRRVGLTSSTAAVVPDRLDPNPLKVYDEHDWNRDSSLTANPYRYSKRLAEEAAWRLVERQPSGRGMTLTVLNPSFLLGPPLSRRHDSTSVALVAGFLEGKFHQAGAPAACHGVVDVRDVARAHVRALEVPEAGGRRFVLSSEASYTPLALARILETEFGDWPLPTTTQPAAGPPPACPRLNHSRAERVLGLRFTPVEEAV